MKRIALGFSILLAAGLFVTACDKKNNTVPDQDTEVQSAVLASYMNYVVSDIDMMISFMGENTYLEHFYAAYPGSSLPGGTGTVSAWRSDTSGSSTQGQLNMSFNKTRSRDGRSRNGTVILKYIVGDSDPNAKYMRSKNFNGTVLFSAFQIDSFEVNLDDGGGYLKIVNTLPTATFSPKNTNITWTIDGKLKFTHLTNPKKNMVWEGHWTKTLANTSNTAVVVSPTTAIKWTNAIVNYKGTTIGKVPVTAENGDITPLVPFSMQINSQYPLTRDFKCTPDPIGGVTYTTGNNANTGTMVPVANQHHPFVSGVASFTIGEQYPREIYYGNEGHTKFLQGEGEGAAPTLTDAQCDNNAEVVIKGISYRVDLMK